MKTKFNNKLLFRYRVFPTKCREGFPYAASSFFRLLTFAPGKSCTTSSREPPQGRKAARINGCSGAMQGAYPFFVAIQETEKAVKEVSSFLNCTTVCHLCSPKTRTIPHEILY